MNVPRIKGSHNAMMSGKIAAEAAFEALKQAAAATSWPLTSKRSEPAPSPTTSSGCATSSRCWSRFGSTLGAVCFRAPICG